MHINLLGAPLALAAALAALVPAEPTIAQSSDGASGGAAETSASAPTGELRNITFNFKGATFEQVIGFFSRTTGLPVVWEAPPPEGTLDYISPEIYTRSEALKVLNIILQSKGVMLRVDDDMLYLQKLTEMQKEDIPTFTGIIPAEVTDDQIITVVRPLDLALAGPMAEKLAQMVASYGSVAALEEQNALVITETAAQVRRLVRIIEELDREDPEGAIRIFVIKHAKAKDLMEPLKALLSRTVEKIVMDKQNKPQKIQEQEMSGLNISFDERTNSIIAKGQEARIEKLAETIDLLDVPSGAQSRSTRTFALSRLAPAEAVRLLSLLYKHLPEDKRPTLLPLEDTGRLTVIGSDIEVAEAALLLDEIDGPVDSAAAADQDRQITVIALRHARPEAMSRALQGLLNRRQQNMTRLLPGPDGRSLIVAGLPGDVEAVRSIVPVLDTPVKVDRQVRLLRLTSPEPAALLQRTRDLYDRQVDGDDPQFALSLELDEENRVLTMIGSAAALDRFAGAMRMIESNTVIDRETRHVTIRNARPTRLVAPLQSLTGRLLKPRDGTTFHEPTFEPIDELDLLLVTAVPEQLEAIGSLIETLDKPDPADVQFRVITIAGVEQVDLLLQRVEETYDQLAAGYDADDLPRPLTRLDELTGNLIVTGTTEAVRKYEQALAETRPLLPPPRTGRMIALRQARASEVVTPLLELLDRTAPVEPVRSVPEPQIEVIEQTNSLYVVAEPIQHQMIERYVRDLDTFEQTELPPLKLIQVRAADALQLSTMLRQRYDSRPAEQRRDKPVDISADAGTNTLIVTAHEDVFAEIKEFVDGVNRAGETGAERETMIFALQRARAMDLAAALDKLYPEPPMPMDRRGRPMPHLRQPRDVYVSADAATNTLIVEAPAERKASFEALVEQLDRVELPPTARLRTYHIDRGDPDQIARTLMELSRQGVLSEQPADGSKPVDVLIQAEPKSRTLIVAGDEVTFTQTEQVLKDLQAVPVPRTLRVFEITGADPQEIADRALELYQDQTKDDPDARAVDVQVDREGGNLLAVAEDEAMFRFAAILDQLKGTIGPPPDVRLIPLQYADAAEVVEFLRDLAESHLTMVGGRAGPIPTFEPIERTNSILVAAQRDQHDIIQALVRGLDVMEPKEMPPLRILQLRTADAANLANALNRQYNQRPLEERNDKPVNISSDDQTNSLIIAAHPDLLEEIEAIVTELNTANRLDTEGREIRIFPLKVARAEELAKTIDDMFPQPPPPVDRRGRPMPQLQEPREVVVRADPQTNSIIVDAPIQRMAGFEQLVEQLDRTKLTDDTEVRTYKVVYADLNALAATLQRLSQSGTLTPSGVDRHVPVTVTTEPVSRTLIVSGPVEIFDRVEQVLVELDARGEGPATALRFFRLDNARAETMASMLREILLTRIQEDVPDAGANVEALLNVTADRKTNTLIISAPESIMPVAEEIIEQLDSATAAVGDPVVRVRPLTFADASEVSASLSGAMRQIVSKVTGELIDVRLIAAPGSNALILVGLEADLKEVESLIEPLDARPAMDAIDAKTFRLAHAEATAIASIVENLLTDQLSSDPRIMMERIRRSRGQLDLTPKIRVEADARTNSLIVSGPQRTVALAETLITQLDEPDETGGRTFDTFTPASADPMLLARTVRQVLDSTRPAGRRSTVELIAEPQSGAVLVIGEAEEVTAAMDLLAKRDAEAIRTPQMDLKVVALQHSDAQMVAQAVSPLLRDVSRWPASLQAASRAGLPIAQPTITADAPNNRLLISAPAELLPVADQMAAELDRPRAEGEALEVRIFSLSQADAAEVAEAVRAATAAQSATRPGEPPITVTGEPSSNTVIVTATPAQLDEVAKIIEPLDSGVAADQAQVRAVFLKHARAETVAPIVEQLLSTEEIPLWLRIDSARRGRVMPETGPEVRVAADNRLNAVVISAPPAVLNIAEQMVMELDVDPAEAGVIDRSVRVLAIANADAAELAQNLEALFDDSGDEGPAPTIRIDTTSNSLLIRATDAQFEMISQVVEKIDSATIAAARQMRMIPIDPSRASAADVAAALKRMLDRSGSTKVEVITVDDLLKKYGDDETAQEPGGVSSSAPLPFLSRLFYSLPAAVQEEDAGPALDPALAGLMESINSGSDITIAVDPETNSLIVVGSPRAIERVADLARQVQEQIPAAPGTIRYIGLPETADAEAMSQLISQTLAQITPPGGNRGDLRRRIAVVADAMSNSLVVTCNDRDFETVGQLVAALSHGPLAEQIVVKVYPLDTTTADHAANSIRGLISGSDARRGRGRQAQRMRKLAMQLMTDGRSVEAVFDPERIQLAADAENNTLVVSAPPEAIRFIDKFVALIDQTPVSERTTLKLYPLRYAKAQDLTGTLRTFFRARYQGAGRRARTTGVVPDFAADERTNTLLVTASPRQLEEVDTLLEELDQELGQDIHPLRVVELKAAQPNQVADLLRQVVIGSDQQRDTTTLIVPDDNSGVLLVRASEEVNAEIDEVLAEIDRDAAREFEIRTIMLERADASAVADAVQRFYDDRAKIASTGRGRREQARRISIIGDSASKTLLVAASDDDFEQIQRMVEQFDSPQATDVWTFRVFQLQHARASEIEQTVNDLIQNLTWNQEPFYFFYYPRRSSQTQRSRGSVAVRADERLNALIATGEGDKFDLVEDLIQTLDAPPGEGERRGVRLYRIANADLNTVAEVVRELFTDASTARRWWMPANPHEVKVRTDEKSNTLIISGTSKEHAEIAELIASIDTQVAPQDQQIQVVAVQFAQAVELARTLQRFLVERARAINAPEPAATIAASPSANSLVVSADAEEMATIRDLIAELDQPDVSGDRTIEIIALKDGDAEEIARIIGEHFGRRTTQGVIVTSDIRTNSLIVNAPQKQYAQVMALIEQLDAPKASDETIIRTYALEGAQAEEAVRILTETLQLDSRGETRGITIKLDEEAEAVEVIAKVVADERSNSLIVTATAESFPVIESLVKQLDEVPAVSPVEYRIITLKHAMAEDVSFTLSQMTRTWGQGGRDRQPEPRVDYNRLENQLIIAAAADQFDQLMKIIDQIDQPSQVQRTTDFVPLQFAKAEQIQEALSVFYGPYAIEADTPGKRNVRIVADPASNSLVISADETEWADIRALLAKLDSQEYDSSLQLEVIPLTYADARSVARAINEAFRGQIERQRGVQEREPRRGRGEEDQRDVYVPTVLVEAEEWVRASAEEQTNSVIVSASRQNVNKIRQIVTELDVADYAKLPPPQLIVVKSGDPEQLAQSLSTLYDQDSGTRGPKALRIVGDKSSNTIIVRAEDEEFAQIKALAEALQQEASDKGLAVHVLKLNAAPASRVAAAIEQAYQAKAGQDNQPLSIQVDAPGNNLVIASTGPLFEEIRATVMQMDELSPAAGQGIFIIELQHISPEAAQDVIRTIGLDQPQPDDSVSRLVTEPIKVSVLQGRNALIVVANPIDQDTIVGLLKAVDSEPALAESQMRLVRLENSEATAMADLLEQILSPSDQQADTDLARAVQEQVRRLSVRRDGLDEPDLMLDLTTPIRVIPDEQLNAVLISSTPENVAAIEDLLVTLDKLPITGAVTVQIFPLENIAADQFARIVRDMFDQGKELARVPGTDIEGLPGGVAGKALLDEIAVTIDDRTNAVIVAGKEDAVAFVEVLATRLDADIANGWIEPRIVQLTFADATDLAETLHAVLVEGVGTLPQSNPLQRQIGRLRMARMEENGGRVIESDVFQPMTHLVIRAEPQLNALVLVGTPKNLEVIGELVAMLDVEAASPSAAVRIYPVEHASASRLASTLTDLFQQQVRSKAIRAEDAVIIRSDERTNALIVTTSPRSFAVLEGLIDALDVEIAPDLREIRRIALENASADRLASLIQRLMDARLERLRKVQPETADLEKATIVADSRTNSLVVAAGNESFEVVKRLAEELDDSTIGDAALVHVIPLDAGNVERIAEAVSQIMERRYADLPADLKRSQMPLVLTDLRTNSLLVAANTEDLGAIEDLVAKLEAAPVNPAIGLHVIALDATTRAETLAPRLQRLMRERQQSLGESATPSDRVTIEPDPASNSLIIAASDENLQVLEGLIEVVLAADTAGDREFEVISLATSRATDIVALLDDLYVQEANRSRGADTVQVTADERLNAVIVNAPEGDVSRIRDLVAQLDGAKPATVVEIKYIALTSANALETVSLIENVLSGRGIGGRRTSRQATVINYLREIAKEQEGEIEQEMSEMEVSAAVRESITLTPDLRTNTVIVSAPKQSMGMIEQMIRDLDESSVGAKNIRIFKLVNADALAMAEILTDLFNLRQGSNIYVLKPREGEETDELGMPDMGPPGSQPIATLGGTELTAVPDERQQLSITVDSRTNSLLVSGSPTYLDLVATVVEELDALEANEREVFVYQLRNSQAEEVARVVGEFVEQEQQKLISTLSAEEIGSRARLLEREITIQGDIKSNTVLVSASPRYMERVKDMIRQLDIDPPQVLIQVMLAEVTIDTGDDWGVDMELRADMDGTDITAGFGLASAFVTGVGVPSLSIAGTDFDLLIKALQSQGRVQLLSNPSVMAANNEPARIQVGETISVITSSSVSESGQATSTIGPEDTGVILEVTPSINPDGFVRMSVSPSISNLSDRTTQISENFEAPIITKRTADTTVTVYDGQTVVIGGLIADRFERRDRKVPFFGDIPLIGALFRSHNETTVKTELLIVLTPHVIESPAELEVVDELTDLEIDRLTVPEHIKEQIRRSSLQGTGGLYDAEGNRLDKPDKPADPAREYE
ncbi:MAG: hypothetical protein JSV91_06095 [Phycisphaerales bacterium]|nr:MAG: hypothetical protein JSV91_06095 [Phycisphaerales bacterium]